MPTRTPKIKVETKEEAEEFAESFKSEGSIVSELPAHYKSGKSAASKGALATLIIVVLLAGGIYGYNKKYGNPLVKLGLSGQQAQEDTTTEDGPVSPELLTPPPAAPAESGEPTPEPPAVQPPAPTAPITVEIRNGTPTAGLAKKAGSILGNEEVYTVSKVGNAVKDTYAKTVVVTNSTTQLAQAQELAKMFSAEVATLPKGEAAPQADMLVILGADYKP